MSPCVCPSGTACPGSDWVPCVLLQGRAQHLGGHEAMPGTHSATCGALSQGQACPQGFVAVLWQRAVPLGHRGPLGCSGWWQSGPETPRAALELPLELPWARGLGIESTSRGLPSASVFSLAALAGAILTSKLSSLLSFIHSDTNQLLRGWFAPCCSFSQSAFDSICWFIKSNLFPILLSLTWIYLFSLALSGHINSLCLVPNLLCIS